MPFQSSLRFRLLALLTGCLLVVIAIGLACFRYLAHDIREYQDLLGGPMSYAQGIDETNLEFKRLKLDTHSHQMFKKALLHIHQAYSTRNRFICT